GAPPPRPPPRRGEGVPQAKLVVPTPPLLAGEGAGGEVAYPLRDLAAGWPQPRKRLGFGIGPTGASISVGPSCLKDSLIAERSSSGLLARRPCIPNASASLRKSGFNRSLAMVRPLYDSCWMRLTLPKALSLKTIVVSGMLCSTAVESSWTLY